MVDVKKIRTQLFIALGSLAVLLVGIGGMGLFSTSQTNNGLQTVYEGRTVPLMGMAEVNDKWQIIRLNAVIAANSRDAAVAKTKTVESAKLYQEIEQIWSDYSASEMTAEESALYKTYNKQAAEYEHTRQRTMRMAGGGDFEGAIKNGRNDATNKFRLLHDTLFELVALQGAVAGEEFSTAQSNFHTVMAITLLTMILGLVLVVYFTRRLLGAIIDPLDELNVRATITDRTCIVSDANLKGEILSVNDKYVEISQYSRDELIGQPHSITRHPDMAKATFKKVWSTIGRGGIFQGKIKNRAKDGTPYYVDAVISPVLGANGKPRKYIGVRYDIAAAEIERQNMEGIFSAINSSFGYIELDINGNVLTANQNFLQLMEYQLDEIVGKHHRMFVDPAFSSSAEYTQFWDDLKAGKASTDTFQRITKSGKGVWIQATYSPIKDEMGRMIKVAKIATDVTKEKLEVLGQLDAIGKAQAMIEFSIDGVILNANTNFLDMFGYTQNEVSGQNYSFLLDPANRNAAEYRDIWEKLRRGEFDAGQYKYAAKDGRTLWIQTFHSALLDLSNKPFKVVMYATEITQQINASQMLELAVVQTKEVIAAAKEGDLEQRVSMEGKTGEIAELCSSVNSLLETTDVVMSEVGHVLSALAKGDLNEKVTKSYQGAFGKLSTDVNLTAEKLQEIVGSIAQSANIISVTSGEIASGNGDLSERTEKQAANLEETAASIEELTSTVKQNADNAQRANQLAIGASGVAEKGEQGRGFAVVATEVRNLAQRSAAAAKEIKTLIGDSVNKVEDGTKLVDEAGDTMNEIVQSIKNVTDIMGEITAASREQSIGIKQVNDAITQVDEVTQQNAALVEQSAAAAEEMQNQAKRLTQAISVFNLRAAATKNNATDHKPERRSVETRPFSGSPSPGRPVSSEEVEPRVQPAKARASSAGREDDWSEF